MSCAGELEEIERFTCCPEGINTQAFSSVVHTRADVSHFLPWHSVIGQLLSGRCPAGLLWVWPTAVSLNNLGAGPREEDIPILPEAEVRSGDC